MLGTRNHNNELGNSRTKLSLRFRPKQFTTSNLNQRRFRRSFPFKAHLPPEFDKTGYPHGNYVIVYENHRYRTTFEIKC